MSWTQAIECVVVVAWLAGLAVKVTAQHGRGVRSLAFTAGPAARRVLEACMVGALFLWLVAVGLHGLDLAPGLFEPRLFASPVAEAAGALLALASLALGFAALWTMGRSWRIGIDHDAREKLITTGVFRLSRNPIFVSFDLLALAVFLLSGSLFFLITAVLIAVGVHVQILREEAFLAETFGAEYESYRRRVGRYLIPRPKPQPKTS